MFLVGLCFKVLRHSKISLSLTQSYPRIAFDHWYLSCAQTLRRRRARMACKSRRYVEGQETESVALLKMTNPKTPIFRGYDSPGALPSRHAPEDQTIRKRD